MDAVGACHFCSVRLNRINLFTDKSLTCFRQKVVELFQLSFSNLVNHPDNIVSFDINTASRPPLLEWELSTRTSIKSAIPPRGVSNGVSYKYSHFSVPNLRTLHSQHYELVSYARAPKGLVSAQHPKIPSPTHPQSQHSLSRSRFLCMPLKLMKRPIF